MKKYIIIAIVLLIAVLTLFFLFIKEEWQENEILNVAVRRYPLEGPQGQAYAVSVFADGSLHVSVGQHDLGIWRNGLWVGEFVNRAWPDLNDRGYWQLIWRGSVQLAIIDWEERIQLSEGEFARIKELISAVDENKLSGSYGLAHTADFLINTRRTRYYAQDSPGTEDDRAIALLEELREMLPERFFVGDDVVGLVD